MAILNGQVCYLDIFGTIQGQSTYSRLYYAPETDTDAISAVEFTQWFDSTMSPLLTAIQTIDHTWLRVYAEVFNPDASLSSFFEQTFNRPGLAVGETLPPNSTVRFVKIPDNTAIEGTTPAPFRRGRLSISGVPENVTASGVLGDVTYLANCASAANELLNPLVGGVSCRLFMFRSDPTPNTPPASVAFVSNVQTSIYVGTQNSRKRY